MWSVNMVGWWGGVRLGKVRRAALRCLVGEHGGLGESEMMVAAGAAGGGGGGGGGGDSGGRGGGGACTGGGCIPRVSATSHKGGKWGGGGGRWYVLRRGGEVGKGGSPFRLCGEKRVFGGVAGAARGAENFALL